MSTYSSVQAQSRPFVRRAWTAEHREVRTLVRAAYDQYAGEIAPEVWATYQADLLDMDRHARDGDLLVAVVGGEIAATRRSIRTPPPRGSDGRPAGQVGGGWRFARAVGATASPVR
jgi:hypothetical protein